MEISSRGFNKDNLSLAVDVLTFALTIFGVFVVYSASYYQSQSLYGDEFLYLKNDGRVSDTFRVLYPDVYDHLLAAELEHAENEGE